MKEQPPPHAKCKDKFLVCSAEIPVEKESMALTDYVSWSGSPLSESALDVRKKAIDVLIPI